MGKKIKVGILTFGDGRDFLQKPLTKVNEKFLNEIKKRLRADGFNVVTGDDSGFSYSTYLYSAGGGPPTIVAADLSVRDIFDATNTTIPSGEWHRVTVTYDSSVGT